MSVDDRQRYFIVVSVIFEIVQPLLRTMLQKYYSFKGHGSLQAFLNNQLVIHILFHLRHRNALCCRDNIGCRINPTLPLIKCQWNRLYKENAGQPRHNCHCKFIANPVQLNELDITLASLILLNCCHLGPSEETAVHKLRRYKNDYLSHNINGAIDETEYKSLWTDLTTLVLQIDPTKQEDLIRIEKKTHEEGASGRYSSDVQKRLNLDSLSFDRNLWIEQGIDDEIQIPYHTDLKLSLDSYSWRTIPDIVTVRCGGRIEFRPRILQTTKL